MRLHQSLLGARSVVVSLLTGYLLREAQALATAGHLRAPAEKRYYHHDVHLDENQHNDEFFTFVTRPDLDAPRWDIEIYKEDAIAPGYWFSAPYSDAYQSTADAPWNAPHIYDGNGDLIWSGAPLFDGFTTFDFRVINVQGKAMLSLVYPRGGKAFILDHAYQIHKIIDMGREELRENELALNSHEFTTTPDGLRALYMNRLPKRTSIRNSQMVDFDGECFAIFDGIQELDTETWEPTHDWNSEGYIGLDETYADQGTAYDRCAGGSPWDFFHANSIDTFMNGDFLVSGRRTNAIYRISRATGDIIWRLGGRKSSFNIPLEFSGQHSAKIYAQNDTHTLISFLDNAFLPPARPMTTNHQSRGLLLALDTTAMTVEVLSTYPHPEGQYAMSRGNMDMLSSTNAWICWADDSLQSEHAFDGSLLMKARFKAEISSYRTFKSPWIGTPDYPPDVHATIVDKNGVWYTIVHMSWNGATEVKDWRVYNVAATGGDAELLATVPKRGFETSVWTGGYSQHVIAEAVDMDGIPLARSHIFQSLSPLNRTQPALDRELFSKHQPSSFSRVTNEPLVNLVGGMFLGLLVSAMISSVLKKYGPSQKQRRPVWWRSKKETYEPLGADSIEESVRLVSSKECSEKD